MILINGDSWTKREPAPEGTVLWPDFLKENTGYAITNLALPGSSNQRIYRTTLEALYSTTDSISHLIIGWSSTSRAELPSVNGSYLMLSSRGILNIANEKFNLTNNARDQIFKTFYNYCHNDKSATHNLLIMLLSIQDICRQRGIKLLNFFSMYNPILSIDADFLKLYDQLDLDLWLHVDSTMQEVLKDFPFEKTIHVGTLGNQRWAEIIKERL